MLKIYNIEEKQEYLEEVVSLTQKEWGKQNLSKKQFCEKVNNKIEKIKKLFKNKYYCKLILLDNDKLVGFISIFPTDGEEKKELSPWYSTMYVKEEYRKKGYSKILNDAILKEAKKKNKKNILKKSLDNYYEKFGAKYIEKLKNNEKLYYIDIK